MIITETIDETRRILKEQRASGKTIGFVPTMGYLHRGHTSLVETSKLHSDFQVMSLFVNRIQFNDSDDFNKYPKDFEADVREAESNGVDLLFAPRETEMYHNNHTSVDVDILTENLCGAHRPGHFKGVCTVVSKLFNIVQPDVSVFGQKDIQQAVSIEKMTFDLNFPVEIIIAPTIRESDGLAMSSRNRRLTPEAGKNAVVIFKSLERARDIILTGENKADKIISAMKEVIESGNPDSVDYISAVSYSDLKPVEIIDRKSVIAVAAFFSGIRLIDNMIIDHQNSSGLKCVF